MSDLPPPADIDFTRIVRAGDHVMVETGTGEPQSLTRALLDQRHDIGPFTLIVNALYSGVIRADNTDGIRLIGPGAIGGSRALSKAGRLEIFPSHFSQIPRLIADKVLPVDVYLTQIAAGHDDGEGPSFGVIYDSKPEAIAAARSVVAERNARMPWIYCEASPDIEQFAQVVEADYMLPQLPSASFGDVERQIAAHVAELVENGSILQIGVGAIPDAVLVGLTQHKQLGIHSALITDGLFDLVDAGAITGETKPIDTGKIVAGLIFGTERLYAFADHNPDVLLRPMTYTHSLAIMARFDRFVTLNTAVEIDLSGQVNAEMAGSQYVGGVTGLNDFVRGARAAKRGRSILAMTATARGGSVSRITSKIASGVVTVVRSDVDTIVTEFGVAELLGQSLSERARRLIAIAHPDFRADLKAAARIDLV